MKLDRAVTILCFIAGCCIAAPSIATETTGSDRLSEPDVRQQVLDLGKRWADAENKHDEATLRRILDDKFLATFGARPPIDKETFIKIQLRDEVDPTVSQVLTDETVIIDQDTAIEIGTDTETGTHHGVAYKEVARYTCTYVRRQGQWLALAEHMVDVPEQK